MSGECSSSNGIITEDRWEDPKSQRLEKTKAEQCLPDEFTAAGVAYTRLA